MPTPEAESGANIVTDQMNELKQFLLWGGAENDF